MECFINTNFHQRHKNKPRFTSKYLLVTFQIVISCFKNYKSNLVVAACLNILNISELVLQIPCSVCWLSICLYKSHLMLNDAYKALKVEACKGFVIMFQSTWIARTVFQARFQLNLNCSFVCRQISWRNKAVDWSLLVADKLKDHKFGKKLVSSKRGFRQRVSSNNAPYSGQQRANRQPWQ